MISERTIYLVGWLAIIVGVAIGAYLLNVPTAAIVLGLLIFGGGGSWVAKRLDKQKDSPSA